MMENRRVAPLSLRYEYWPEKIRVPHRHGFLWHLRLSTYAFPFLRPLGLRLLCEAPKDRHRTCLIDCPRRPHHLLFFRRRYRFLRLRYPLFLQIEAYPMRIARSAHLLVRFFRKLRKFFRRFMFDGLRLRRDPETILSPEPRLRL